MRNPVRAERLHRHIAARQFVLALRARFDARQAQFDRQFDRLIIAKLEVQERHVDDAAPIAPIERIAANQQIESALGRLFVVVENYPQLRSNENFLRLQDELAGTENRIAVERKRYNDSIQDYNTFIGQFPNSFFAGIAGFTRNDAYFEAAPESRTVPKVNFGRS